MILTDEEISILDVYCHEGTERPFGGPATDLMTTIAVQSGDTLNLQWAYLREKPPTGPMIGTARKVSPPLPWANREAVLRRDAEIATFREKMQRILQTYEYLWNRSDPNWVLLKALTSGYCVFNKQGHILIIEDDELNDAVCKRMKDAGCEILETLPELNDVEALEVPMPIQSMNLQRIVRS